MRRNNASFFVQLYNVKTVHKSAEPLEAPLLGAASAVNFDALALVGENPLGPSPLKSVESEMTTKAVQSYRTSKAVAISSS
jgi:hypothetical protein